MKPILSKYKWKRLANEALKNSIRLHADSIYLYRAGSYPSAFQLSVLALEELSKALWVDHYYYSSVTNEGFPDYNFEQEWLALLYKHPEKQFHLVARNVFEFSPKLVRFIQSNKLELKKQSAVYVGLRRSGRKVDTTSRISTPACIKSVDAKQIISLVNQEFVDIYNIIDFHETYFGIYELDEVIHPSLKQFLFAWPHKSGLKGRHFRKQHIAEANHAA